MNNITLEITSTVAELDGGEKKLADFAAACSCCGFAPAVQLHNTVSEKAINKIIDCGLPMSAHAPVMGDYSLNLATEKHLDIIFDMFELNADFMRKYSVTRGVFHGFSMCDELIPRMRTQEDYKVTLRKSCPPELLLEDTWLNTNYTHLNEYKTRRTILKNNLAELRKRFPDLLFCIENDMPVYGYSNMKLEQMRDLEHPICIDTGHLWAASLLLDFDFFEDLEYGLKNLDVRMVHLHNSFMTHSTPKTQIQDGHQRLIAPSEMDWRAALVLMLKYQISDFVLEIGSADADDVYAFAEVYRNAEKSF